MNKFLLPLALGLLLPTAALAQINSEVAAQCKDARDFYGCVRAFTTPPQFRGDRPPLAGVMGPLAAGLIAGPMRQNTPSNFSQGVNPAGLVEGILRGILR